MPDHHAEKPPSRTLVMATVSFYLVAAMAMIFANKWVLNKTVIPFFFLFMQLAIAVVLLFITNVTGLLKVPMQIDFAKVKGLAPMITINVLGLNFNNLCLKYIDASFYQVARGLILPITVTLSWFFLSSRPSLRILLACAVVTSGFFIGIFLANPSAFGMMFGFASSFTTAMHAVVIKRSLDVVKGNTIELAWYSNVISAIAMVPIVILAGEIPLIHELFFGAGAYQQPAGESMTALQTFLWGTAITGTVGFLICIAGFMSIKVTSPITHMISAAVRGVFQALLGMWLFGDIITSGRAASIGVILTGSIYYTWVKNEESVKKEQLANGTTAASKMESGQAYEAVPMHDRRSSITARHSIEDKRQREKS